MKKFLLSAVVVLMSISSFAQTGSRKVDTGEALKALIKGSPTASIVGNVDPKLTLEDILSPLIHDIMDGIATGLAMGDDDGSEKELSSYSMKCEELTGPTASCVLEMNRKTGIGTSIMFEVEPAQDGSMKLSGSALIIENDI